MSTTTYPTYEAMIAAGDAVTSAHQAWVTAIDAAVEAEDAYTSTKPRPAGQRESEYAAYQAATSAMAAAEDAAGRATAAGPAIGAVATGSDGLVYVWRGATIGWMPAWPNPSA